MFKKRNNESTTHSQTIFPKASELIKKASEECRALTAQEILDEMLEESSKGKRRAYFFRATISDCIIKELE